MTRCQILTRIAAVDLKRSASRQTLPTAQTAVPVPAWVWIPPTTDNDGWMDLFVANIDEEIFALYRNHHDGSFENVSMPAGIGMSTRWLSGWGLKFFDYDNDGDLDLILSNGSPDDLIDQTSATVTWKEPLLLFHREEENAYRNVSAQSGPAFARRFAARGLAIGDFNNDGALDALISNNDAAPLLLRNNAVHSNHWLGVLLVGRKCNRDAVGARIGYQAGDLTRQRMKVGGGSFLSSHDPRLVLGIGARQKLDWLEVTCLGPAARPNALSTYRSTDM